MPNARYEKIQNFLISLTVIPPPSGDRGNDIYMWRNVAGIFSLPRFAFTSWLAFRGRLLTRDRLTRWGLHVPATCVLCSSALESHDHLFFECNFSFAIWSFFASKFISNPPRSLGAAAVWIQARPIPASQSRPPEIVITKLILQTSIYTIWKERNSRIFTLESSTVPTIRKAIDRSLRDFLLSLPSLDSSSKFSCDTNAKNSYYIFYKIDGHFSKECKHLLAIVLNKFKSGEVEA
ncbi:unnamed protein product [Arabidopsis halleri]